MHMQQLNQTMLKRNRDIRRIKNGGYSFLSKEIGFYEQKTIHRTNKTNAK